MERPARKALAVASALVGALLLSAAAPAATFDYTKVRGLSQPRYGTVRDIVRLPAFDGRRLYVEVVRPKAAGRFPVILEASPYHGTLADRDGTRILPEPRDADGEPVGLTGYFAPRGYAVVMMDLRGTGRSQGCLDHLGPKDARDLEEVVEWAASSRWSNGKVGMTGHSYVGSTPPVAAAQDPEGLATIVPSAGLASMYDHQFHAGVPFYLQWAGPIEAYEQLAIQRKLPPSPGDPFGLVSPTGDDFGNSMEETGCGLPNSAAVAGEDQLSGRYARWHEQRDHSRGATGADLPVFLVHGVNDDAARVSAMGWFTDRRGREDDKLWLGQWDHGSGCCPTRRGIQWTAALHAWFDRHLKGRDVETGPSAELFLSDSTFEEARAGARTEVLERPEWPGRTRGHGYAAAPDGTLSAGPADEGAVSFAGDPAGHLDPRATGGATFVSAPLVRDMVLAGVPRLRLAASVTAPRVHLVTTVYDESPDGDRRRVTQCSLNPELRDGIAKRRTVVPGQRYALAPPCYAMAHHLRAGHRIVLRTTTSDPDKVPLFSIDPRVTVFTGAEGTSIVLPVVPDPELSPDRVPLTEGGEASPGPAQAPQSGTATPPVGAPVAVEGVTTAAFEFTAIEDADNAKLRAVATPSLPADVDLALQRRRADGSWSADLATGVSPSLSGEQLEFGPVAPGRYRVVVHNWAGLPGTEVEVEVTFFNARGAPGT